MKDGRARIQAVVTSKNKKHKVEFTEADGLVLLKHAEDILNVKPERSQDAWEAWAKAVGLS